MSSLVKILYSTHKLSKFSKACCSSLSPSLRADWSCMTDASYDISCLCIIMLKKSSSNWWSKAVSKASYRKSKSIFSSFISFWDLFFFSMYSNNSLALHKNYHWVYRVQVLELTHIGRASSRISSAHSLPSFCLLSCSDFEPRCTPRWGFFPALWAICGQSWSPCSWKDYSSTTCALFCCASSSALVADATDTAISFASRCLWEMQ